MVSAEFKEIREDVRRWVEEGPGQLSVVLGLLHDHARLRERVEVAEREQERLREEVMRLRGENEHHHKERLEVAEQLSDMMNRLLLRLRPQQP